MSKNNNVGNLSLSTTVVTHFILLCAALLAIPAISAAQPTPLAVQGIWMRDAGSNDKTAFAPGETIQFAAELNNSYGGILASVELTITTSFYNNSRTVDIPPGISTWTWNATAPSTAATHEAPAKLAIPVKSSPLAAPTSRLGSTPNGIFQTASHPQAPLPAVPLSPYAVSGRGSHPPTTFGHDTTPGGKTGEQRHLKQL